MTYRRSTNYPVPMLTIASRVLGLIVIALILVILQMLTVRG